MSTLSKNRQSGNESGWVCGTPRLLYVGLVGGYCLVALRRILSFRCLAIRIFSCCAGVAFGGVFFVLAPNFWNRVDPLSAGVL